MSDVAVSYSSAQRSEALALAKRLRDAGLSVWLDDQSEVDSSLAAIGVPTGQQYWAVIESAIDAAAALLVLDTPEWRSSVICRREHSHAYERGKRIAVIPLSHAGSAEDGDAPSATWPVSDLEDFVNRFHEHLEHVRAHTRLLLASLGESGTGRSRRSRRLRSTARLARDVAAVLSLPAASGARATAEMMSFARGVLQATRRARLAASAAALLLVGIAATFAVVAVSARAASIDGRREAVRSEATQQSLQLALAAQQAPTSHRQRALAAAALASASTDEAWAADRRVSAAASSRVRLRPQEAAYHAAALSDDAQTLVLGVGMRPENRRLLQIDIRTGQVRSDVAADVSPRAAMMVISPEGDAAVAANDDQDTLVHVDFGVARARPLRISGFTAFAMDGSGALWWSDRDGRVQRLPDLAHPADTAVVVETHDAVTALTVDADGSGFDVILANGDAVRYEAPRRQLGSGFIETSRARLFNGHGPGTSADDAEADAGVDQVLRCGSNLIAFRGGSPALTGPGGTRQATQGSSFHTGTSGMYTPGCIGDAAVWIALRGSAHVEPADHFIPARLADPADGAGPFRFASNRNQTHLVVARPSGYVDVISLNDAPRLYSAPEAMLVLPFAEDDWRVDFSGVVRRNGVEVAALAAPPVAVTPIIVGDTAVIATTDGLALVRRSGASVEVPLGEEVTGIEAVPQRGVVVTTHDKIVVIADIAMVEVPSTVAIDAIASPEAVSDLAVDDAGGAYVTTNFGRLIALDTDDGAVKAHEVVAPALSEIAVVAADIGGQIAVLVYGADGVLREFNEDLETQRAVSLPGSGRSLLLSPDRRLILVGTTQGHIKLLDTSSLEVIGDLAEQRLHSRSYVFSPDGRHVVGVHINRSATDDARPYEWRNQIEEIPLTAPR